MQRRRSTLGTCFGLLAARSKPKQLGAATRADPTFAEAWYKLSDLLGEQGRSEAAIDCLRRALLLQRGSRHNEAADYWRQYLANDAQSEWAARPRRSLKFCEMQIHLSAC